MKIDLITLHNVKNYGSALQTYATQTVLKKMGYEVEIIDYSRKDLRDDKLLESKLQGSSIFSKNLIMKLIGIAFLKPSIKKQCKVFNNFLKKNINLTKIKYYNMEDFQLNMPQADIFCSGSDQVWNSEWNQGIEEPYFLNFLDKDKPRFSYASSFGKNFISEEEKRIIEPMLKKYKKISVRENVGLDILKDMGINNAFQVLDPTLLLNKEEWKELCDQKIDKKYILVYQLNSYNPDFDAYVKKLSKKKRMPVFRFSVSNYQCFKYGKLLYCKPVEEFIKYFNNAEYIVTDSFHATGFAINFNKKFLSIFPKKFSSRIQSILELTGLEERHVQDFNNLDLIDKEIDYSKVNKIIQEERLKSKQYLEEAIKTCIRGE